MGLVGPGGTWWGPHLGRELGEQLRHALGLLKGPLEPRHEGAPEEDGVGEADEDEEGDEDVLRGERVEVRVVVERVGVRLEAGIQIALRRLPARARPTTREFLRMPKLC